MLAAGFGHGFHILWVVLNSKAQGIGDLSRPSEIVFGRGAALVQGFKGSPGREPPVALRLQELGWWGREFCVTGKRAQAPSPGLQGLPGGFASIALRVVVVVSFAFEGPSES